MNRLEKTIHSAMNIENVNVDLEAEHEKGKKAKEVFCKSWPAAEVGLAAAQTMVKNPIPKLILSLVILLGKSLSRRICEEPVKNNPVSKDLEKK